MPGGHCLILVTGGCRSGKSEYARRLAERCSDRRLFVATARAEDADMHERILAHQRLRGRGWRVYEAGGAPRALAEALPALAGEDDVVLLDCLTLWAAGCMEGENAPADFSGQCDALVAALCSLPCPVLVVTNEVGMGLVPPTRSGRTFRDMAGIAGQKVARAASAAVLVACGLPLVLKGSLPVFDGP